MTDNSSMFIIISSVFEVVILIIIFSFIVSKFARLKHQSISQTRNYEQTIGNQHVPFCILKEQQQQQSGGMLHRGMNDNSFHLSNPLPLFSTETHSAHLSLVTAPQPSLLSSSPSVQSTSLFTRLYRHHSHVNHHHQFNRNIQSNYVFQTAFTQSTDIEALPQYHITPCDSHVVLLTSIYDPLPPAYIT